MNIQDISKIKTSPLAIDENDSLYYMHNQKVHFTESPDSFLDNKGSSNAICEPQVIPEHQMRGPMNARNAVMSKGHSSTSQQSLIQFKNKSNLETSNLKTVGKKLNEQKSQSLQIEPLIEDQNSCRETITGEVEDRERLIESQRIKLIRPETQQYPGVTRNKKLNLRLQLSSQQSSRVNLKKSQIQPFADIISYAQTNQASKIPILNPYVENQTSIFFTQSVSYGPQANMKIEKTLSKDEKLNLLKLKKAEKEQKIKSKLDIYTSVRPFKAQKEQEKAQNEYLSQIQRQFSQPQLERLYQKHSQTSQIQDTSRVAENKKDIAANLPKQLKSQQSKRIRQLICPSVTDQDVDQYTACSTNGRNKLTISTQNDDNAAQLTVESKPSPQSYMSRQSQSTTQLHLKSQSMTFRFSTLEVVLRKEKALLENELDCRFSDCETESIDDFKEDSHRDLKQSVQSTNPTLVNDRKEDQFIRSFIFKAITRGDCQSLKNLYDICEVMLRSSADPSFRDSIGRTILHIACMRNCDKNMIEMIINYQLQHQKSFGAQYKDIQFKGITFDSIPTISNSTVMSQNGVNTFGDKVSKELNIIEENNNNSNSNSFISSSSKNNNQHSPAYNRYSQKTQRAQSASRTKEVKFEQHLKRSQQYKDNINMILNWPDNYGRTPLHYAVKNENLTIIKILVQARANLFFRDHKSRRPIDFSKNSKEVQEFLNNEMITFEDNYRKAYMTKDSEKKNSKSPSKLNEKPTIFTKPKILKNIELGSLDALSSYSNEQLASFTFGIFQDNALTYMIRIEDRSKFEYLLGRGILASICDSEGYNAIHYAIRMERIQFLSFLLEGDYQAYESLDDLEGNKLQLNLTNLTMNKSYMMQTFSQMGQSTIQQSYLQRSNYQLDALLSIDKSSYNDGLTPFHEAAKQGNEEIMQYMLRILTRRNEYFAQKGKNNQLSNIVSDKYKNALSSMKSLKDILEFTDNDHMTPLLIAAKSNNAWIVKMLIKEGANIFVQCNLLQNPLHFAVINQNSDLISYLLFADAEASILRNERNYKNLRPEDLDTHKNFTLLFNNIFELITHKNQQSIESLNQLLKQTSSMYSPEMQTPIGRNSPLHLAILHNNIRALRILMQSMTQKSITIYNADNKTPKDFANMLKNDDDRYKTCMILGRDFSYTQSPTPYTCKKNRSCFSKQPTTTKAQFDMFQNVNLGTDFNKVNQYLSVLNHKRSQEDLDQIAEFCESDRGSLSSNSPVSQKKKVDSFAQTSKQHKGPDSINSGEKEKAKDIAIFTRDKAALSVKTRMESASDPTVPPLLAPVDNIEVEKFVTKKYDEYSNEGKRLGTNNINGGPYLEQHDKWDIAQLKEIEVNQQEKALDTSLSTPLQKSQDPTENSSSSSYKDTFDDSGAKIEEYMRSYQQPINVNLYGQQDDGIQQNQNRPTAFQYQGFQQQQQVRPQHFVMQETTNLSNKMRNQVAMQQHLSQENNFNYQPQRIQDPQINQKMEVYYKANTLNAIPENWELESKTSGMYDSQSRPVLNHSRNDSYNQLSEKLNTSQKIQIKDLDLNLSPSQRSSKLSLRQDDAVKELNKSKIDLKREKVEAIKTRIKQLFLNYCDYSLENGNIFITYTNFMKILKDANIYDEVVTQNSISILLSKECNVTMNIIKHITFDQFLNSILRISEIKYPKRFKKHPKSALKEILKKNILPLLKKIESAVENHSDEFQYSLYTVSELTLKLIVYNEDTQVLFCDILPIIKLVYQRYFDQEASQSKIKSEENMKISLKSIMQFARDFELCPYLVHQKACFLIWYSVAYSKDIKDLTSNAEIKGILPVGLNIGKHFTLGHFIVFLYRLGVIYFNHSQNNPQDFNLIKKLLFFLRKLENSEGFRKFMSRLSRTYNDSLTFLPSKDLLGQILKAEGVEDVGINPEDYGPVTKEAMLSRIIDHHLIELIKQSEAAHETSFDGQDETEQFLLNSDDDLKKLFEIYCSFGDPLNTRYLKSCKLMKLLKECGVVKNQSRLPPNVKDATQLAQVDIDLAFKYVTAKGENYKPFDQCQSCISVNSVKDQNASQSASVFLKYQSQMLQKSSKKGGSVTNKSMVLQQTTCFDQKSYLIDRGGQNGQRLDFVQFKSVLELLSVKIYPQMIMQQAYVETLKNLLLPQLKHVSDKRCIHNNKISKLLMMLDNQDMINLLTILHRSIIDIYKVYSDAKGYMNFQQFIGFCTDYDIFPLIATKASLYRIYHSLSFMNEVLVGSQQKISINKSQQTSSRLNSPSRQNLNELIDEHLFVESLALIALYTENDSQDNCKSAQNDVDEQQPFAQGVCSDGEGLDEFTPVEKILQLVEKMANSEGVYRKLKKGADIASSIKCNLMDKKDLLDLFRAKYPWYFKSRYQIMGTKKANFQDIMEMSSMMTEGSQLEI